MSDPSTPPASDAFTEVAPWYDELMSGVPYNMWVRYIEELVKRYGLKVERVLDLACGTGKVSRILANRGFAVVGVDASPGMIEQARRATLLPSVRYKAQRMQDLELGEQFDLTVCLFDSLNYVLDPEDVRSAFRRVAEHLRPGGLFIFDVNTEWALEQELFTQRSLGLGRRLEYEWKARYDRQTRLCEVDMRFFVKEGGRRREFRERHVQRAYSREELEGWLREAGLEVLDVFEAYTTDPPRATTDRMFLIARRPDSADAR